MRYKITIIPSANVDFAEIVDSLYSFSTNKASNFVESLEKQLDVLAEHPKMYAEYEKNKKYRKMIVLDIVVFYYIDDENKEIVISRMIAGRMDIPRRLN